MELKFRRNPDYQDLRSEVTPEKLDHEIEELELQRDASNDYKTKEAADAAIAQLEEAKEALKF